MEARPPKELKEFQKNFRALVTGSKLSTEERNAAYQDIVGDDALSSAARVGVYEYAWSARIFESLMEDYEILARCLGSRAFKKLIQDYLKKCPSQTYTLVHTGIRLPEFLKTWRNSKKKPWHVALAQMERDYYLSFYGKDQTPWDNQKFIALANSGEEKIRFLLEPTVFLIKSKWDVREIWMGNANRPTQVQSYYLVCRKDFRVEVKSIRAREYRILSHIQKGATLARIIDLFPNTRTVESIIEWASSGVVRMNF